MVQQMPNQLFNIETQLSNSDKQKGKFYFQKYRNKYRYISQ